MDKAVIMQHLPLHGGYRREGQRIAVTAGHLLDGCCHLRLMNARTDGAIGSQVHLRAQVDRLLDESDLLLVFIITLLDDGLDERHGSQV